MSKEKEELTNKEIFKQNIKLPLSYDDCSHIFDADNNMVLDIRGWGRLKYEKDGVYIQDRIGHYIVEVLNKSFEAELYTEREMRDFAQSYENDNNALTYKAVLKARQEQNVTQYFKEWKDFQDYIKKEYKIDIGENQ